MSCVVAGLRYSEYINPLPNGFFFEISSKAEYRLVSKVALASASKLRRGTGTEF